MRYYAGLDISDKTTNICVVNESGVITHERVASTDPDAILFSLNSLNISIEKVGMETGAKSNWLYHSLSPHCNAICYDAWKMAKLISMKVNKTDRNDAQVIAELTRIDCLSQVLDLQVHVKAPLSQEIITLIRVRDDLSQRLIEIYNQVRAVCKTHGCNLPTTKPDHFTQIVFETIHKLAPLVALSIRELVDGYDPTLRSLRRLTQEIEELVKQNTNAQLLTTIPEVGPITALYFAAIIDDPNRFSQAQSAGSYFGLTPFQYSSGQQQHQSLISKRGDPLMRKLLVGLAQRLLRNMAKSNALKRWGQKKEKKKGKGRAAVALARHLSVIMLAMLMKQSPYIEPVSRPSQRGIVLTTEELGQVVKLAEKTGKIELKSIQQLKKLARRANVSVI